MGSVRETHWRDGIGGNSASVPRGFMRLVSEHDRCRLVGLLWVYLILLLVEGILRKWLLPEWSDVLLIVRDPVAFVIIGLGFRSGALTLGDRCGVSAPCGSALWGSGSCKLYSVSRKLDRSRLRTSTYSCTHR